MLGGWIVNGRDQKGFWGDGLIADRERDSGKNTVSRHEVQAGSRRNKADA